MLRKLLFRIYLFFKGIRFYETDAVPKTPEFKRAVFETVGNHQVEFFFYREFCEDLIFKRGTITKETFTGYVIQARLDSTLPENLYRYNNMKFFFNSKNVIVKNECLICDTLLHIYLDFLRSELKKT